MQYPDVNIYQGFSNGKECWVLDTRINDKRQRRYFSTRQKAIAAMQQKEKELKTLDKTLAGYTPVERMEMVLANEKCREMGGTLAEAVNLLQREHEARSSGNITELIEECMDDKEMDGLRPRSLYALRNRLENFRDDVEESRVGCITAQMIRRHILTKDWVCSTKNGALGDIRTFFSWLKQNDHISESPAHKIRPFRQTAAEEESESDKQKILTTVQVEKLFRYAEATDPELLSYMALIFFGGLRPEREAPAVKSCDFDEHEKTVHVRGRYSKDRQSRYIELNPTLDAWTNVFPFNEHLGDDLNKRWAHVRMGCDLFGDNWPHDAARHTFASNYLATHTAEETIRQLGHGNYEMLFKHYRTLVKPSDAKAYWKIMPSD